MQNCVHLCGQSEETHGKRSNGGADGPINAQPLGLHDVWMFWSQEERQEGGVYNPTSWNQIKFNSNHGSVFDSISTFSRRQIKAHRIHIQKLHESTLMTEVLIMGSAGIEKQLAPPPLLLWPQAVAQMLLFGQLPLWYFGVYCIYCVVV